MSDKDELQGMLTSIIDDKSEQAQTHFHTYLQGKMQEVMSGDNETDDTATQTDAE